MKSKLISLLLFLVLATSISIVTSNCSGGKKIPESGSPQEIVTNESADGIWITVNFKKGKSHNHPLMAIWIEDAEGRYIETLYVAQSIGKGVFEHGEKSSGQWMPGAIRRPAALPYWGHQRGIRAADGYYLPTPEEPIADAITGPTPQADFILKSKSSGELPEKFKVMMEINQSWDWNEFWTNNKFPDDEQYKTSSQPALVYEAQIDMEKLQPEYKMTPVGHSHYSGLDGNLYTDLTTLTTALNIAEQVTVTILKTK